MSVHRLARRLTRYSWPKRTGMAPGHQLQHALRLAAATPDIETPNVVLVVTDGEPTAHLTVKDSAFAYRPRRRRCGPPSPRWTS